MALYQVPVPGASKAYSIQTNKSQFLFHFSLCAPQLP